MTSRQRLLAAARRQETDLVPVSPRLGYASRLHFGENTIFANLRLKKHYDFDPHFLVHGNRYPFFDAFATFQDKPQVRVEIDISDDDGRMRSVRKRYTTPDGRLSEEFRVPVPGLMEFGESPNPVHKEYLVKEPADLKRLRHLIPAADPAIANGILNIENIVGEEGLCQPVIYGALDHQAGAAMSMEDIMVAYLQEPQFAQELVGMFHSQLIEQTRVLLEAGLRYVFCAYYYHSLSAGWSPKMFAKWFLPLIKEHADLIHSYEGLMFYYDDGRLMDILPYLVEAGVDVVETCTPPPVGDFDLEKAKREYGDKLAFKGYIDLIYVLQKGTVEDVRRAVESACDVGSVGGGFILGTSDSMRAGTPSENIDAYFRYGREYGSRSARGR